MLCFLTHVGRILIGPAHASILTLKVQVLLQPGHEKKAEEREKQNDSWIGPLEEKAEAEDSQTPAS